MVALSLDRAVRQRAGDRCEYCHLPASARRTRLQIEHIIAFQHGGETVFDNLALACARCNRHKGPNLSGIDRLTKTICVLFNPRRDQWDDHFRIHAGEIFGLTRTGRATIPTLAMNDADEIDLRNLLNVT